MPSRESFQGIRPGQVHVWYAAIDRMQGELGEFERLLSPEETERAQRFRKASDRKRYLVRQGILRRLLSQYLNCDPSRVEIQRDVNGKPNLSAWVNPDHLQFSESHSENMAAYAFGCRSRLGIDIEQIREFPDMLEIVEQHFTRREKQEFLCRPEDQRLALFYRFWTRKEAVLKAHGGGLLKALDSVDVAAGEGGGPWRVRVGGEPSVEEYSVADIAGPANFAMAVATAGLLTTISISVNFIQFEGRAAD